MKVIENEINQGVSKARNIAIDNASGDYITFVDADDYVSENYLECLYKTALEYNADIVFTNNIVSVQGDKQKLPDFNCVSKWIKTGVELSGISDFNITWQDTPSNLKCLAVNIFKLWKRSFLDINNIKFVEYPIAEDCDFLFRSLLHNPLIAYNHKPVYYYVTRWNSAIANLKNKDKAPIEILNVFENIFLYYQSNAPNLLIDSNYWNFRSMLYTFDIYNGKYKFDFYSLMHKLLKRYHVEIHFDKHPFLAYQCNLIQKQSDYALYTKNIEAKKRLVNMVAWFIPSFALRNIFRRVGLDYLAKKEIRMERDRCQK